MKYREICIKKAHNGFIIEGELDAESRKGLGDVMYAGERELLFVATNEAQAVKQVKGMLSSLTGLAKESGEGKE